MFWSGSTAIDGLSGNERLERLPGVAGSAAAARSSEHGVDAHRLPNILQQLFAEIDESLSHPVANLVVGRA